MSPYRFIGGDPNNGALRGFEEFLFGGEWKVKTKSGTEPLAYRLTNGFFFRAHEPYGDVLPSDPVPPIPMPDPEMMPDDIAAFVNEKRFGLYSIADAVRAIRTMGQDAFDRLCASDFDFRQAANAADKKYWPFVPREPSSLPTAEKRYTTFAQLTAPQQNWIQRHKWWAGDKKFALRIDRSGVKYGGIYFGIAEAECACGRTKAQVPLSAWTNNEIRDCGCGIGADFNEHGDKL